MSTSEALPVLHVHGPPPKPALRPRDSDPSEPHHTTLPPTEHSQKLAVTFKETSVFAQSSYGSLGPSAVEKLKEDRRLRMERAKKGQAEADMKYDFTIVEDLSLDDKYRVMLGNKTSAEGKQAPYLWREDYCGACGVQHPNPVLLDVYLLCEACSNSLRAPSVLRTRVSRNEPTQAFEVCFATYGHPTDARRAYEVTERMQEYTKEFLSRDRIVLHKNYHLDKVFGRDPCPGEMKQLRIRYRMNGVFAMVVIDVLPENKLPNRVLLICPQTRDLLITQATWGHPRGRSSTGRMSIEVTEQLQGLVDMNGGSYLYFSHNTSVSSILSDPCPGYSKDLRISYDISGRHAKEVFEEMHGHLQRKYVIETSPVIKPIIFVKRAFYGITYMGRRDYVLHLQKQIRRIQGLNHRKLLGGQPSLEEAFFMAKYDNLVNQRDKFKQMDVNFFDVTSKMQQLVDEQGGLSFKLNKQTFDPNMTFGDPTKQGVNILEVDLVCTGHDSENYTEKREMTVSGYPRNVIPGKNGRFVILCRALDEEEERTRIAKHLAKEEKKRARELKQLMRAGMDTSSDGKETMSINFQYGSSASAACKAPPMMSSKMESDLVFETANGAPMIMITRALYGHRTNLSKCFSVTMEVQNMVEGSKLVLDSSLDLNKAFGDPTPGVRKCLQIDYTMLGFLGNLRIRERGDGCLVAAVELGYPPQPPRDEGSDV